MKRILIAKGKQITIGNLLGRKNIKKLDANKIVARHMAILAMTGGGKTVAAKTLIHEFIKIGYPLVIFDPHGDYLGLSQAQKNFSDLFGKAQIKLFYANVEITNENKWDIIGYAREGANITEAQEGCLDIVIENRKVPDPIDVENFVNKVIDDLKNTKLEKIGKSTVNACIRHLKS